jgi:FkbM family methyltransferase
MGFKGMVRAFANGFGIDIVRLHQSPQRTFLGLRAQNIGTIIDVGANEGQFARSISRVFPKARLYCFEPLAEPFQKLSVWAQSQKERVRYFGIALGDHEGEVEMYQHDAHTPSSSLLTATPICHQIYPQTRTESVTKVRLTTLDIALKNDFDRMSHDILLKLDVQGFEDRVLRGAKHVLSMAKACLLEVCIDHLYEGQADFFVIAGLLNKAGYRFAGNFSQVYGEDGRVIYLDALFLKRQKAC